jgi:hypothetical protein
MPPVALNFDLIKSIVEHGARSSVEDIVDPSTCSVLCNAGVALVTTYIEQLSLLEIVCDPLPLFGEQGGLWIGYRLSDHGRELSKSNIELRRAVSALIGGPKTEVAEAIKDLLQECSRRSINEVYRDDFLRTLEEMRICFDAGCFIAVMALCGKILEVCLKEVLIEKGIPFDQKAMIGSLIKIIHERQLNYYDNQTLMSIADIINRCRITAIHATQHVPLPTRDQTIMVVFATRDVVQRSLTQRSDNE